MKDSGVDGSGRVLGASAERAMTLSGEWISAEHAYGFRLSGSSGVATLSNSPRIRIGQEILTYTSTSETTFRGRQMFADGRWFDVTGRLLDERTLEMSGNGYVWTMSRRR
jgi:hypothetical protein